MSDDRERDKDGFPIYRPTPQEMAETRARMSTLVDCRALAAKMATTLPDPSPAALASLADDHGIDGSRTLTEIEGQDLGDACDVADEAIVHALRYVPVARWSPGDVCLMLDYGHGVETALALAERYLNDDPAVEARLKSGDLLEVYCRLAPQHGKAGRAKAYVTRFAALTWALFDTIAEKADMDAAETAVHRARLLKGTRAEPGRDPFLPVGFALRTLHTLLDCIDPPEILAEAQAKQLFAKYRPRKSVELVPLPDLENPACRRVIDDPETFTFRRNTVFRIARERSGEGVRLRIHAASAIDHSQGIWHATIDAAKSTALRDHGINAEDWRPPRPASSAT